MKMDGVNVCFLSTGKTPRSTERQLRGRESEPPKWQRAKTKAKKIQKAKKKQTGYERCFRKRVCRKSNAECTLAMGTTGRAMLVDGWGEPREAHASSIESRSGGEASTCERLGAEGAGEKPQEHERTAGEHFCVLAYNILSLAAKGSKKYGPKKQ
jgi:hypothetical protein